MTAARRPVDIPIFPCLRDHRFAGRAVLPAVEAMQILAATLPADRTDLLPTRIRDARFDKFLFLPDEIDRISAFHEIAEDSDGETVSRLMTRTTSAKGFSRIKEHVTLRWERARHRHAPDARRSGNGGNAGNDGSEIGAANPGRGRNPALPSGSVGRGCAPAPGCPRPFPATEPPEMFIPSDRLYAEMVPFAPAFHNLAGGVRLWPEGATAEVFAPDHPAFPGPLGSPFPLDAAFHAACAWSQRYAGIVAFPVGLAIRDVMEPTRPGERYRATILRVRTDSDPSFPAGISTLEDSPASAVGKGPGETLAFDIHLTDDRDRLRESAFGVEMRDVSGGRLRPPSWVHGT